MELTDLRGIRIGLVEVAEALDTDWTACHGAVDVVRVERPLESQWPDLSLAGFLPKPAMVTWIADVGATEADFLSRLSPKSRRNIRAARRAAQEELDIRIEPVTERLMDLFLPLYSTRVAEMDHGWAVAVEQRDTILETSREHFAVAAYRGGRLIGCCICWRRPRFDVVAARFSAVDSPARAASLARVLYLEMARIARADGFARVSLGKDPNLYGHIAKPGLFGFKARLGFTAVPSQCVDPEAGYDQADLIVSVERLTDPAFFLSYADRGLRLEVVTRQRRLDCRPFEAGFVRDHRFHVPAAWAASKGPAVCDCSPPPVMSATSSVRT